MRLSFLVISKRADVQPGPGTSQEYLASRRPKPLSAELHYSGGNLELGMFSRVRGSNAIFYLAGMVVASVGATIGYLGTGLLEAPTKPAASGTELRSGSAFQLRVRTWATLDDAQEAIDAGGIVAFDYGHGIALGQHEHLGGARNIAARRVGSLVRVTGAGSIDGTYRVTRNLLGNDIDEADLGRIAQGRLVAYTCVGPADDGVRQIITLEPVVSA